MNFFDQLEQTFEEAKHSLSDVKKFYKLYFDSFAAFPGEQKKKAFSYSQQLSETSTLAKALHLNSEGWQMTLAADFERAISQLNEARKIFADLNEEGGIMAAEGFIGVCYRSMGQLDKAQKHIQNGLKYSERVDLNSIYLFSKSVVYYQAAELNLEFKNYETAIKYYNEGLKFTEKDNVLYGRLFNGLGVAYIITGDLEKALDNLNRSLEVISIKPNKLLESKIYSDIGTYHFKKGEHDLALENEQKSLKIRIENKYLNPATTSHIRLAEIYFAKKDNVNALLHANKAVEQAEQMKTLIKLYEAHEIVSKIHEETGNLEEAYHHYKKFHQFKEEVHNQDVMRKIEQLNSQHKMDTLEKEQEIFKLMNVELKAAFDEIENKQKEILDSIHYAKRIQNALITSEKTIERNLDRLLS